MESNTIASEYAGRCFLYVLVMIGPEDLLKVGMTHDPLGRWTAFHPRWFEAFDLDHSMLIETETRADAQALETQLHRRLIDHRCPMPFTIHMAAGGATEWYRGAFSACRYIAQECEGDGYRVHYEARELLSKRIADSRDRLSGLVLQAFDDYCCGALSNAQLVSIRNLVDAHRAFGAEIDMLVPSAVRSELGIWA